MKNAQSKLTNYFCHAALAYFMVFALNGTSISEVVQVAGMRWSIEMGFAVTKDELGLDYYEVRSWRAWYRHVTLVFGEPGIDMSH